VDLKESFRGELEGDRVIVKDSVESGKIHNKGSVGRFSGGMLVLTLTEAFYLINEGKLSVDGVSPYEFLKKAALSSGDFEVRYLTYRDLKKRGFIVEDTGIDMKIARGGEDIKKAVVPLYERVPFDFNGIYSMVSEEKKIFGIVDGDGDLTYYSIEREEPHGPIKALKEKIEITVLNEMAFTENNEIHRAYYGKTIDKWLQLSIIESIYLVEKGIADIRDALSEKISPEYLKRQAEKKDPEFMQKLKIYSDLRDRGLIVKTGFKYGTHFRVYVRDIEHHAPYLVHAVPDNYVGTWPEISRGVRLAHGVKKDFLLAEASDPPKYLKVKRVRL